MKTIRENLLILTDAVEGLRSLPDQSIDLIVTDPPYDTLEKWRNFADWSTTARLTQSKRSSNKWFPVVEPGYFEPFFEQCWRVLKENTHLYVFCDPHTVFNIDPMIRQQGFERKKTLIWHKVGNLKPVKCPGCSRIVTESRGKGQPGMGYPYRSCYENIYFAAKGSRGSAKDKSVRDVLEFPRVLGKGTYPTQKPQELIQVLIRQSSEPGDLVLDPFAGSGATLLAAWAESRRFLGFDIQQDSLDFFHAKLEPLDPEPECDHRDDDILGMFGEDRQQEAEEYKQAFEASLEMPLDGGAKLLAESQELIDRYKK